MNIIQKISATVLALFALTTLSSFAQDDDFSLPGDAPEAPAVTATSSSDSGGEEAAPAPPKQYANFFEKLIGEGGFWIWPLIMLSLLVVGLFVYCMIDLSKGNFFPDDLVRTLKEDMETANLPGALSHAEKSKTCLGQVMYGGVEYVGERGYQVLDDSGLYDSMADASQEFNRGRARTINYFSVVAQIAPMVGLLGTVSGMIKAFDQLGNTKMSNPGALATNISEAMLTTLAGLVVAIPALVLYFVLRDRLGGLISASDRHAVKLLNVLRKSVVSGVGGGTPPNSAPPNSPPPSAPQPPAPTPNPHAPAPPQPYGSTQ